MINEFRKFILRGNVIDLAVGIIIGAAFTAVVNSLVADIILPPIGQLLGGVSFSDLFIALDGQTYPSLAAAQAAGVATINYGLFIDAVINLLIVGFAVFLLIKAVNNLMSRFEKKEEAKPAGPTTEERLVETLDKLTKVLEQKQ